MLNAKMSSDTIFLDSYRYRQTSAYQAGFASVVLTKRTSLTMSKNDIKVYVKVDSSDLSRVNGLTLKGSEQPWSQMSFISNVTNEKVKICVQIQPSSQAITQSGLSEVQLTNKRVFTVLDDSISCTGVSANGVTVFNGILSNYLSVDANTKVESEVMGDMKAGNRRVGTQVEFKFEID